MFFASGFVKTRDEGSPDLTPVMAEIVGGRHSLGS